MTIQTAIKKSIEGGYRPNHLGRVFKCEQGTMIISENIYSDPNFWKCLGKALGWPDYTDKPIKVEATSQSERDAIAKEWGVQPYWLFKQHQFIDHLASEKSAELYFKELN